MDFIKRFPSLGFPIMASVHEPPSTRERRHRLAWRTLAATAVASLLAMPATAKPWPRHMIDASSRGADGVRLGDLDRDGLPDVVTGWEEGGTVRVCFHPGPALAREPWPSVTVGQAPDVEDAAFVDLNGDGILEVVSSCEGGTRRIQIHEWTRLGHGRNAAPTRKELLDEEAWRTRTIPVTDGKAMWMFAVPWSDPGASGSGLIVGAKGEGATISRLWTSGNDEIEGPWQLEFLRSAGWIMTLTAADLDADGDPDLVFSDRKGAGRGVAWLENPGGKSTFANRDDAKSSKPHAPARWIEHPILPAERDVMFIDLRRESGANAGWWLATTVKPRTLVVSRSDEPTAGGWQEMASVTLPDAFGTVKAVRFADLNQDDRMDLVFTCEDATGPRSGVGWFPGLEQSPLRFDAPRDIGGPEGVKYDLIELLDLDGDGDLDVMTCEERDNLGVVWYENPWRKPEESRLGNLPRDIP